MAVLDFKEIPEAHLGSGKQDAFEQLAADTLLAMGYEVIEGSGRGVDQGKDLIVSEKRKGIGRETEIRWLVSCKHKAYSGKAVGLEDEPNMLERVMAHECQGFLGFYSTIASSGLLDRLKRLLSKFENQVFDNATIERHLLSSERALQVAKRYFPISIENWAKEHPRPAKIFASNDALLCEHAAEIF